MSSLGSLQRRAQLAVALTVGFYLLAIGIAALLLFLVYVQVFVAETIYFKIVIFCVVGAGAILWSIVPRFVKFVEPGPRLDPETQPELFAVLRDVAAKTRQEMPAEVYLIPDVNAYVSYRSGRFGLGSRKIMGLGLTLMESLSVPQFRAAIAHEFGHYANEDLKFGGWIYRTRAAIERTVHHLGQHTEILHLPFVAYGKFFIRITQEISRAQELAADRLAAAVTSAKEAASTLVAVNRAGFAYVPYIETELAPVLARGYRPPLAKGFAAFAGAVSKSVDEALAELVANAVSDVDDSHPPLRERVEALGETVDLDAPAEGVRATSLLRDLPELEAALITAMWSDPAAAAKFASISWEEAGARVFVPAWRENVSTHADALQDVTPSTITGALPRLHVKAQTNDEDEKRAFIVGVAGSALATRLHDLGWMCVALPGKPVAFTRDGRTIEPFLVVDKLQRGELTPAQWDEECRAAGLI